MRIFIILSVFLTLVFVGLVHAQDGSIVTWGDDTFGQCDIPEPKTGFVSVTAEVIYGG